MGNSLFRASDNKLFKDYLSGRASSDALWTRFDEDKNGIMDNRELHELMIAALKFFCKMRNPNTTVDPNVLTETARTISQRLRPRLDPNGDGVIDREEFEIFCDYFKEEYAKLERDLAAASPS